MDLFSALMTLNRLCNSVNRILITYYPWKVLFEWLTCHGCVNPLLAATLCLLESFYNPLVTLEVSLKIILLSTFSFR